MKAPVVIDAEAVELPPTAAPEAIPDQADLDYQAEPAKPTGAPRTAASEPDDTGLPAHPEDCECEQCAIPLDGHHLPPTVEHLMSAENAMRYLDQEFPRWRDYWPPACVYIGKVPMFHRAELQAWIGERRASEEPPEEDGIVI